MSPSLRRGIRPRLLTGLAGVLVMAGTLAALGGCAMTGSDTENVAPESPLQYPEFATYPDIPVVENVAYGRAAGQPLLLDVCLPEDTGGDPAAIKPRAAIISVHGGSWARGDKAALAWRSVCQWFASEGFVGVSMNYRLVPASVYPAQISDVRAVVRWLREPEQVARYTLDPTLIGAFGGSAGGHLVSLLGTEGSGPLDVGSRVAAVAELSGPTDLTDRARRNGSIPPEFEPAVLDFLDCVSLADCPQARVASPVFQVDSTDPPFFIGHSSAEFIPIEQAEVLATALRGAGVDTEFVTVDGSLHAIALFDDAMRGRIAEFFTRELTNKLPGVLP